MNIKVKKALISVYDKDNLEPIVTLLHKLGIEIYSTGGTQTFIEKINIPVNTIEKLTDYPALFGGRVKTLHPKVFGAILNRADNKNDKTEIEKHKIPKFDIVIVDLYPFKQTIQANATHQEIIEKIDVGGVSLIRAAAKNYNDVIVISSKKQYAQLTNELTKNNGSTNIEFRKQLATQAFVLTSQYDQNIANYFQENENKTINTLRYGENPHQKGQFIGNLNAFFEQINGKECSYNNLLDIDAAVSLMKEFSNEKPTFAILKHNNTCGIATRETIQQAYMSALACDPISAFGGILIANKTIDKKTAQLINELFCEVVIAPKYDNEAVEILKSKKNRIVLIQKLKKENKIQQRSVLNGILQQETDDKTETANDLIVKTKAIPTEKQIKDLLFANKIVKHLKSNAIVLASEQTLIACGVGQTSRVDALKQAIARAKDMNADFSKVVMASDAFFPFPDCVELANNVGITAVVQPGGSIKDQLSIDYCNQNNIAMVFTGVRHFKH